MTRLRRARGWATVVGPDGAGTDGPTLATKAVIGGFSIMEVSTRVVVLD